MFDAWHLPGTDLGTFETLEVGELVCRYPVPTPELLVDAVHRLREAGKTLADRPVMEIVEIIDAATARLADPIDPLRQEAEEKVGAATGYSPAMTRRVLDRMTADWRADRLRALLDSQLGDPEVLDAFRPAADRRLTRAYGPGLAFHVFAGNVPGVAVTSMVRALLVKAPSFGKLAAGQPVLPILFTRAVDAVDPDLGRALAVTYWPGGSRDAEWRLAEAADVIIVYGGADAVATYRERTSPGTRLVVHGPRFSVGLIAREAIAEGPEPVADAVARAVADFDQHGCVSPHAVWIEEGGVRGVDFAHALAAAMERVEAELPRGRIGPAEASAIQQERAAAELRGHAAGTDKTLVLAGEGTRWTVIYDAEPAFRPSCLNRLVRVHPIADLQEAVDLLAPVGRYLQSVAFAGPDHRRDDLADPLARLGATRITSFERLPWPPPTWHHDGHGGLNELVRWVDVEAR